MKHLTDTSTWEDEIQVNYNSKLSYYSNCNFYSVHTYYMYQFSKNIWIGYFTHNLQDWIRVISRCERKNNDIIYSLDVRIDDCLNRGCWYITSTQYYCNVLSFEVIGNLEKWRKSAGGSSLYDLMKITRPTLMINCHQSTKKRPTWWWTSIIRNKAFEISSSVTFTHLSMFRWQMEKVVLGISRFPDTKKNHMWCDKQGLLSPMGLHEWKDNGGVNLHHAQGWSVNGRVFGKMWPGL